MVQEIRHVAHARHLAALQPLLGGPFEQPHEALQIGQLLLQRRVEHAADAATVNLLLALVFGQALDQPLQD